MFEQIRLRISEDECGDDLLVHMIDTISNRLCLRLGEDDLPERFEGICCDCVVKMFRRMYFEGLASENVANLSESFVEDILNEYSLELAMYNKVVFL